jgi:lipopolysaccharide export system protein LptC
VKDRWLAYVPALLLAALAALSYWLDEKVQPQARHESSAGDPDFLVEDFVVTRMDREGKPRYVVQAKKLVHYPGDNSTTLEQPQLTHFDPQTAPVTIRANQGLLSNNGETATFTGDVLVRRLAYGEEPELSLQTSFLQVIPDQDLAKTDREVTLTRGNSVLHSVGLEFNNATRSLKLLSRVRGSFETPPKDSRPVLPWEQRR